MKNKNLVFNYRFYFLITALTFISSASFSQQNNIKGGAIYNFDLDKTPTGKLENFFSYEFNYELFVTKHSALVAGVNYGVRRLKWTETVTFKDEDRTAKGSYRYYLRSQGFGLFFNGGLALTKNTQSRVEGGKIVSSFTSSALTTFFGAGIKHPLSKHIATEFELMYSPSLDLLGGIDYGTSGYIRTSFNLLYTF